MPEFYKQHILSLFATAFKTTLDVKQANGTQLLQGKTMKEETNTT